MSRGRTVAAIVAALVGVAGLVLFAVYNRGNAIALEFGVARWRGEAVYALYAAVFVGLLLMFVVSLPADLAERRERKRLERRVRDLADRASRAGPEGDRPARDRDDSRFAPSSDAPEKADAPAGD